MYFITQYNNKFNSSHGIFYLATPDKLNDQSGVIFGEDYNFTNMQQFVLRAPERYFFKLTIITE